MVRLTATEAARNFSDVLNRVAAGEQFEIVRNGAPAAVLGAPAVRAQSPERYGELMRQAPEPDAEFASDLRAIRRESGGEPGPWHS